MLEVSLSLLLNFCFFIQGYSGSDIRLVCKEAAMKPLRRLMKDLEKLEDYHTMNWDENTDPAKIPMPGPVEAEDFMQAV